MEAFFVDALMKGLVSAGLPALLMGFAVWVLNNNQSKLVAKLEQTISAWQADVKLLYGDRIKDLEKRSDSCEKDRDEMRKVIWNHLEDRATDCKMCTNFNPKVEKPIA